MCRTSADNVLSYIHIRPDDNTLLRRVLNINLAEFNMYIPPNQFFFVSLWLIFWNFYILSVKNHVHFHTFSSKSLHKPNKCLTFAVLEPPSLLTMLNRRQTESNVKLVWTLPRCEGGRALLKLKSGVVLFLYHYEIIVRQVFYAALKVKSFINSCILYLFFYWDT